MSFSIYQFLLYSILLYCTLLIIYTREALVSQLNVFTSDHQKCFFCRFGSFLTKPANDNQLLICSAKLSVPFTSSVIHIETLRLFISSSRLSKEDIYPKCKETLFKRHRSECWTRFQEGFLHQMFATYKLQCAILDDFRFQHK